MLGLQSVLPTGPASYGGLSQHGGRFTDVEVPGAAANILPEVQGSAMVGY